MGSGLLSTLGLPQRQPKIVPQPIIGITDAQGAEVSDKGARPIAVKATQPADELRPRLDAKEKVLRDAYARLATHQPKLEAAIATASGDTKKAMEAQKLDVDKHMASIEKQLKALDADRRALDDPRTDAKAMNDILARNKAPATVGKAVEVDRHDSDLEKKRTQSRETTTTTELKDGTSTTRTTDVTKSVGLGGASKTSVDSREKVSGDGKTATSVTRIDKLSKDGYSTETVKKQEKEVDGKTSSIEKKTGMSVGPGGISSSDERKVTKADGSSTTNTATNQLERGDGKLGAARTTSKGTTDADGNEQKTSSKTKGGLIAGKDGMGAYGEQEKSFERKNKDGLATGAVAGLNANVVCNVKVIEGTPPTYDLSVSVNLGVSASLSAKKERGKEATEKKGEGPGSVGIGASGSVAVFMNRHYVLSEGEASAYVASLKAASAGGGGGTQQEFAVIRTGVSKGWDAAREMYLAASGKALDAKELDKLRAGESVETGSKKKVGGSVGADAKGFGVEGGYEVGRDESTKVTKEKDGTLTYDTSQGDSAKVSGGAKVSVGVVEGGASFSHSNTTSTGYKISIDPKDKDAAKLQAALAACKSQKDLDAFAKQYPQTVQEKTTGKGTADTQTASIGIGGAKATLGYGNSVDEQTSVDKDGKLKKKTVTGANKGGMDISVGKYKIGDSGEEKAVAEIDGDGNATVDIGKTSTSTDAVKFLKSLPGMGDKDDKKPGALTKATGGAGPADTDSKDVQRTNLSGGDLKQLGALACNDMKAWMNACPSPRMMDDWRKAGNTIRKAGGSQTVVAAELAKFVGADSVGRADVVNRLVRPVGDVSTGARSEFPDSLGKSEAEYKALVLTACEDTLDALAKGEGGAKKAADEGAALLGRIESLYRAVQNAKGFSQPAVQGEMLGAITARRQKLQAKLRVLGGGKADELSQKELVDQYNELLRTCTNFKHIEDDCFAQIDALSKQTHEAAKIMALTVQIKNLHATWGPKYDEMAGLAQEHGFGKDIYWKYKPDQARLAEAVRTGGAGKATQAQPETADKRKKNEPSPQEQAETRRINKELTDDGVAKSQAIEKQIPGARARAIALSNKLEPLVSDLKKKPAVDLYNQAYDLVCRADAAMQKVKPHYMQDLLAWGHAALEDYNAASAALNKALAMFPKSAPKKA